MAARSHAVACVRTPKGHDAIADVLVEGALVPFDDVRDGPKICVNAAERFLGLLVDIRVRKSADEVVGADIFFGARVREICHLGETTNVRKHDGDAAARANERKLFGTEQLVDDIRRDDLGEYLAHAAAFGLFKESLIAHERHMNEGKGCHG